MIRHILTTAFRNLKRDKYFSFINIIGLAVGVGLFLLIQLWIDYEKSFDQFHTFRDRIYRIMVDMTSPNKPITIWQTTPAPMGPVMEDKIPEIEKIIRLSYPQNLSIYLNNQILAKNVLYADSVFFEYFDFPVLKGNPGQILDVRDGLVITEEVAEDLFGEEDPVGKSIMVKDGYSDEKRSVLITGVFANIPHNSSLQFDVVMPFETFLKYTPWNLHWGNYNHQSYAILAPNTEVSTVNEKIKDFIKENRPDYQESYAELFLHPLSKLHLYDDFSKGRQAGGSIVYVRLFNVISYFLLVIAGINFINLSTANLSRRQKEVGMKKTIGAHKQLLTFQFIMESFLLNLLAIFIGILIVYFFMPEFNQLFDKHLIYPPVQKVVISLVFVLIISTLITGVYPALLFSSIEPVNALKNKTQRIGNINFRDALVVFQFILSISLIIGILVVYKQVAYIRNKDLGFNRENLIRFNIGSIQKHKEAFRQELEKIPGIKSVTYLNNHPMYVGNSTSDPEWDGKPEDDETFFYVLQTDYKFLETLGVTLLEGENFPEKAHESINHYLVNETAVKVMDMDNPVGQNLTFWNDNEGKILGVVKDFHHQSFISEMKPLIIYHQPESTWMAYVKVSGDDLPGTIQSIEKAFLALEQEIPFEYHFLDADFEAMYNREELMQKLTLGLTILALFISALGLFGLTLFTIQSHIKEIAIRKVNGARVDQIVFLLSKDFVKWIVLAFVIASPISFYFLNKWLLSYAYKTNINWWIFGLAGIIALAIALLTVSYQTIRAALANPVDALRYE